jgi:hypothetical protein
MSSEKSIFKISPQARIYYGGMLLCTLVVVLFLLPPETFVNLGVLFLGGIILLLFLCNLEWGLYAMCATCFFYGWEIFFSQYRWTKNIAYISNLNAPVVDFITTLLGLGVGISIVLGLVSFSLKKLSHLKIPLILYGLFLLSGAYAALHAYDNSVGSALKYLIRPMAFACGGFIIIPALLIRKREMLINILKIWFGVGVFIALFGLSSLIFNHQSSWIRVVPYSISGFAPLGHNHNMVAEALVAIIPAALYLAFCAYKEKKHTAFQVYAGGMLLMALTTLLTLSRGGWIVLLLECVLTIVLTWEDIKHIIEERKNALKTVGVLIGFALLVYMGTFLVSKTVQESTATRFSMIEITAFYFERSPWFGYGPGMYTRIMGDTFDYVVEHGEPLESHGFIQKIILEEGIVGLVLFSLFIVYIVFYLGRMSFKAHDSFLVKMFFIMVVGEVTFQLFDTSYFSSVLWLPIGLALVATSLDSSFEHINV